MKAIELYGTKVAPLVRKETAKTPVRRTRPPELPRRNQPRPGTFCVMVAGGSLLGILGEIMEPKPAVSGVTSPKPRDTRGSDTRLMRSLLIGIFIFMAIYALYFARDFFMPVVLAFLLALMLTPIVRFLRKHGMPEPVSATLLVLSVGRWCSRRWAISCRGPVVDLANRRADDRPPGDRAACRTAPSVREGDGSLQSGREGRRDYAGARRAEGGRRAARHPLTGGRQPAVGGHHGCDHLRAVAVPARIRHDVLREDHPVLRPNEREEAGAAPRL